MKECVCVCILEISPHTSLSLNLSKSSLSFSMAFSFSFRLDTSDISSSFWVSSEDLQRSSYNNKWRLWCVNKALCLPCGGINRAQRKQQRWSWQSSLVSTVYSFIVWSMIRKNVSLDAPQVAMRQNESPAPPNACEVDAAAQWQTSIYWAQQMFPDRWAWCQIFWSVSLLHVSHA